MKKFNQRFVMIGAALIAGIAAMGVSMLPAQTTQSAASSTVHSIPYPQVAPPDLPDGPGKEQFSANCVICHSYRYVTMQPKFSKKTWTAEVEKMKKTYGATIQDDQMSAIVDYLMSIRGAQQR